LINNALRAYIEGAQKSTLAETLRRVIHEELRTASGALSRGPAVQSPGLFPDQTHKSRT
jgi:hypothetical protein